MADSVSFELKLVDSVAGPAKRAAAALRQMEENAKKAQSAMSFGNEISKAEGAIRKLAGDPAGFMKLIKAQKELAESRKKLKEEAGFGKSETLSGAIGSKLSFARLASAAVVGEIIGEGILKAGEGLLEMAKGVVEIFTEGFKKGIEEGAKSEVLQLGAKLSLGATGGGEFVGDTGRFSKLTGFDDDAIQKLLLPLRRAGLGQKSSRTAFAAASDIAAGEGRGGDSGRVGDLLETFKKIQLKGGISEKMLISLGVVAKDFYADLAKQLKISPEAAKKKAEEGKIDPQQLLNTVYGGIEKRQGGELGTGAIEYSKTLESRMAKLKDLPNQYLKTVASSQGFSMLSDTFGNLLEKLDPDGPQGQRIVAALDRAFNKITGMLGGPESAFDDIADGIANVIDLVADLIPDVAAFGRILIESAGTVGDIVNGLRLAAAISSGDKEGATAIIKTQAETDMRRARQRQEYEDAGKPHMKGTPEVAAGPWLDAPIAKPIRGGRGKVDVHAPATITVVAAPGEDPGHTAKRVAQEHGKHLSNALERARDESGAP